MPTRIIAPNEEGVKDDRIYEVLLNSCFYRGNSVLETYKPASLYDWWLVREPYVVICHNDSPKRPSGVPAVTAWRGPAGIEWMHMAEFYGVQYETRRMERPRIMMAYEEKAEKHLIKILPYKPTQVFYRAELPTQKPVAANEYFIRTYTNEGDTVLDCCMGSGSTGVAAVKLNRSFIGIERNKKYFDAAVERIEKERGIKK